MTPTRRIGQNNSGKSTSGLAATLAGPSLLLQRALEYHAIGWSLLPVRSGTKVQALHSWKSNQKTAASADQLRQWFKSGQYGGLAVIMGEASGNLACRDFDVAGMYERWAESQPELAATLPTVETSRGHHVYFSACPEQLRDFREKLGKPSGYGAIEVEGGELRAGCGCYVVLPPSIHPDGCEYRWKVLPDAKNLQFISLFESELIPSLKLMTHRDTEGHSRDTVLRSSTQDSGERKGGEKNPKSEKTKKIKQEFWTDEIRAAIRFSVPTGPGQRHRQVFELLRRLKGIKDLEGNEVDDLAPYVERWYELSEMFITTKGFRGVWLDFKEGYPRVRQPTDSGFLRQVFESVELDPLPAIAAADYDDMPGLQQLVAFCRDLQSLAGKNSFFLSCRVAGELLGISRNESAKWLRILVEDGILRLHEKGRKAKGKGKSLASSYFYLH